MKKRKVHKIFGSSIDYEEINELQTMLCTLKNRQMTQEWNQKDEDGNRVEPDLTEAELKEAIAAIEKELEDITKFQSLEFNKRLEKIEKRLGLPIERDDHEKA